MSQWAREHPEAMTEIAAAPLPRQNDLLADAARGIAGREARRQREYIEQTDREIADVQLIRPEALEIAAHAAYDEWAAEMSMASFWEDERDTFIKTVRAAITVWCEAEGITVRQVEPNPEILAMGQLAAVEQFDADLAQIQNADRGLRERGQQILDRLDHTAEDFHEDCDDVYPDDEEVER